MDVVKNFAKVVVSAGYAAGATSITLSTGHGAKLPDPAADGAFNLVWWNVTDYPDPTDDITTEIVRCTARTGDVLTVTRAQESTTDVDHNTATKTYQMILSLTKKMIDDIATALAAALYNIVEDTTPQLGGNLDLRTYKIVGEGGSEGIYVDSNGNVGIGTDNPGATLEVDGLIRGTQFNSVTTGVGTTVFYDTAITTPSASIYARYFHGGKTFTDGTVPRWIGFNCGAAWTGRFIEFDVNNVRKFSVDEGGGVYIAGNVGIGTTAPKNKLDIEGGLVVGATYSGTNTAPSNGAIIEGNVGIGTTSPTEKLDINSDAIRVRTAQTPASAGAAGNQGDICWDADYVYVAVGTNQWKRAALSTW